MCPRGSPARWLDFILAGDAKRTPVRELTGYHSDDPTEDRIRKPALRPDIISSTSGTTGLPKRCHDFTAPSPSTSFLVQGEYDVDDTDARYCWRCLTQLDVSIARGSSAFAGLWRADGDAARGLTISWISHRPVARRGITAMHFVPSYSEAVPVPGCEVVTDVAAFSHRGSHGGSSTRPRCCGFHSPTKP